MNNEKLLKEVCNAACSCDAMLGWTCSFCKDTLPKLRRELSSRPYHTYKSPYKPRKFEPRKLKFSEIKTPYYIGRIR